MSSAAATGLFDLRGRVAVVTGASSGLGAHFARVLAEAGADVMLVARRESRLRAGADALRRRGARCAFAVCDVSREDEVDRLVRATAAELGPADVLVNSAGIGPVSPAEEMPIEAFRRVQAVNLEAAFLCAQRFGRGMLRRGRGAIVNVASIFGLVASGRMAQVAYCASKGGLVQLTRQLGAEWAARGVRVNALAPAFFPTELTAGMLEEGRGRRFVERHTPMGRPGRLEELSGPLLFLASDASSYVTGQVLAVDGGWTAI